MKVGAVEVPTEAAMSANGTSLRSRQCKSLVAIGCSGQTRSASLTCLRSDWPNCDISYALRQWFDATVLTVGGYPAIPMP